MLIKPFWGHANRLHPVRVSWVTTAAPIELFWGQHPAYNYFLLFSSFNFFSPLLSLIWNWRSNFCKVSREYIILRLLLLSCFFQGFGNQPSFKCYLLRESQKFGSGYMLGWTTPNVSLSWLTELVLKPSFPAYQAVLPWGRCLTLWVRDTVFICLGFGAPWNWKNYI